MNYISSDTLHVALVLSVSLSVILFTLWAYEDMSGSPLYSKWLSRGQHLYGAGADWGVLHGVHIGARSTWQIRLNCPYLAVMWPLSNYFDHLFGSSQCMWFHCCRNCGRCGSSY